MQGCFCNALYLNPLVNSITSDTVKAKIDLTFELKIKEIITELQNINSKQSFTLDCWTSMNTTADLGVTIHYINDNIYSNDTLTRYIIENKLLNCGIFDKNGHIRCFGHCLNLATEAIYSVI